MNAPQTRRPLSAVRLAPRLGVGLLLAPLAVSAEPRALPSAVPPASAPVATAQATEADAHFRRGVEHYRAGDRRAAAAAFARAHELSSDYRLLFNMAQVEQDLEDHAEALRLLELYLERGGAHLAAERRAEVRREMAELEQRVASVRMTTDVEAARLWIDDAPAGILPSSARWLNPGVHRFRVEQSGRPPVLRTVAIRAGERLTLDMPLAASQPAPPLSSGAIGPQFSDRTPFWLSVGALGTSAGLAIGFGVLARIADAGLERELDAFPADEESIDASRSRVKTLAAATDVCIGLAALAAGASLYFAFRAEPESDVPARGLLGVGVAPDGSAALFGAF